MKKKIIKLDEDMMNAFICDTLEFAISSRWPQFLAWHEERGLDEAQVEQAMKQINEADGRS